MRGTELAYGMGTELEYGAVHAKGGRLRTELAYASRRLRSVLLVTKWDAWYSPKSITRNRFPGTKCTDNAVSCIGFRGVLSEPMAGAGSGGVRAAHVTLPPYLPTLGYAMS
eukprot:3319502-Rhodomonas_salina.1